jgi:hypothetical protein
MVSEEKRGGEVLDWSSGVVHKHVLSGFGPPGNPKKWDALPKNVVKTVEKAVRFGGNADYRQQMLDSWAVKQISS